MNLNEYKKTGILKLDQEDLNDPGCMEAVNHLMEKQQEQYVKDIEQLAKEFSVNDNYAMAIWYLRTRSRWTQELENKLINMNDDGEPCPNMMEWP